MTALAARGPKGRAMTRADGALVAVVLALVVLLTACQTGHAHGVVSGRIHHGKWRYLRIRQAGGRNVKVRVGLLDRGWRHCHVGDPYPQCRSK